MNSVNVSLQTEENGGGVIKQVRGTTRCVKPKSWNVRIHDIDKIWYIWILEGWAIEEIVLYIWERYIQESVRYCRDWECMR